jgi:hypothetical protein
MTIRVVITHDEPSSRRTIDFRVNEPQAVGYEPPFQELLPGESGTAHVHGSAQIEVREGRVFLPEVVSAPEAVEDITPSGVGVAPPTDAAEESPGTIESGEAS